jgi:hypothetical protein
VDSTEVMRMYSKKREQGLTFISWLVVLFVAGFAIMIGLKIIPVYLDHYAVKSSLESIKNEPLISRKPVTEIRKMLLARLDINSIRFLGKDNILINRSGGVTKVTIKYEERREVVGNLSMIMTFDDSIELISN